MKRRAHLKKAAQQEHRLANQQTQGRRAKNRRASRARRSGARRKHQQLREQVHDSSHSLAEIHERKGKQAALRPLKQNTKHASKHKDAGRRTAAQAEREEAAPSKKQQGFRKHSKHESSRSVGETRGLKGKQTCLRPLKPKHQAHGQTQGRRAKNRRTKREHEKTAPRKQEKKIGFPNTSVIQATLWAGTNISAGGGTERRLQKKTVQDTPDTAKGAAGSGGGTVAAKESRAAQ